MEIFYTNESDFGAKFDALVHRGDMDMANVMPIVADIIAQVRKNGDTALNEQIEKFDKWQPNGNFAIAPDEMKYAYEKCDTQLKTALIKARDRILSYHEKQLEKSWLNFEANGTILGQKITPVDRAGLYIPGGKAAYPSSLLMNAVPAIVAGVTEIVVCTPAVGGVVNEL